jgi:hypothetical protein
MPALRPIRATLMTILSFLPIASIGDPRCS